MSTQTQWEMIKAQLDYESILQRLGIEFVRDEADGVLLFRCLNPDHNDSNPSMRLRFADGGEKNPIGAWRCWNGACERWRGDVFDLIRVMRRDDHGYPIRLAEAATFALGGVGVSREQMIAAMCDADIRLQQIKAEEPIAMPVPQSFPVGAVPFPAGHPYLSHVRKPAIDETWAADEECMYCPTGPYEGYMIIPLRWLDGTTISWQAIAVEPWATERRREKGFKTCASKLFPKDCPVASVLYGCHRAPRNTTLVVAEGIFDVWRIWDADYRDLIDGERYYGVGTMTNRLSDVQENLFRILDPDRIIVLPDNKPKEGEVEDTAGNALAMQIIERLGGSFPVFVGALPVGEDPDSAGVRRVSEAIRNAVDSVTWAVERGKTLAGAQASRDVCLADIL